MSEQQLPPAGPRPRRFRPEQVKAGGVGLAATGVLALAIVLGSRIDDFDAALVPYTFAVLFATFGIAYRYAMWLQRPPTRMYWRRGWQVFLRPGFLGSNLKEFGKRLVLEFAANRFIARRGPARWAAHWLIMWGCLIAVAITFPLVFGWIHFETVPGKEGWYRTYLFGIPTTSFAVHSFQGFGIFHGLVWASLLVIPGVMLAMRRRMRDHGAAAVQQFGEDFLPLILLFTISLTGLMLTASQTWMHGYAYDFLAILHAVTVIFTLLWLPFGKFFHVFQRPAQLGVSFYKDVGRQSEQAHCRRCGSPFAPAMMVRDLATVERQLGFRYELDETKEGGAGGTADGEHDQVHYQYVCPPCRRKMFGLAQGSLWAGRGAERPAGSPPE